MACAPSLGLMTVPVSEMSEVSENALSIILPNDEASRSLLAATLATGTIRSAPTKSACKHLSSTKSIARFDFYLPAGLSFRHCCRQGAHDGPIFIFRKL